ncbi:protein PRRC2A-like [Panicum virgatum]|uniref:Uncharacterized protein n=1 Tax=Panicum virgatum TaxID=38727 RepID=A0A8T0UKG4_PANVG|nr:protein PRRC2A-like [Panicum virgatum]KAG2621323.1 hypothetical protein PVAP13_3NG247700 [Panicum virgatum]KAG2621327.1 hypothetical protein PVAP13_3NG247700 [Panicum virgatum]
MSSLLSSPRSVGGRVAAAASPSGSPQGVSGPLAGPPPNWIRPCPSHRPSACRPLPPPDPSPPSFPSPAPPPTCCHRASLLYYRHASPPKCCRAASTKELRTTRPPIGETRRHLPRPPLRRTRLRTRRRTTVAPLKLSDRTGTGVYASHPLSRDIHVPCLTKYSTNWLPRQHHRGLHLAIRSMRKWVKVPLVRCWSVGTRKGKKWWLLRSSGALRSPQILYHFAYFLNCLKIPIYVLGHVSC